MLIIFYSKYQCRSIRYGLQPPTECGLSFFSKFPSPLPYRKPIYQLIVTEGVGLDCKTVVFLSKVVGKSAYRRREAPVSP